MDYNKLSKKAHQNAVEHGFWMERNSNEHCLMLIVTEIGEMVEADRTGKHYDLNGYYQSLKDGNTSHAAFGLFLKDTTEDEMADVAIRLADLAGALGVDFTKMRPMRYHRAFDKFTFTENAFGLVKGLSRTQIAIEKRIQFGLEYITRWAKSMGVDIQTCVDNKMQYNHLRPMKHGKKY